MAKTHATEEPPAPSLAAEEEFDPVEELRRLKGRSGYEKFLALKGKIHIKLDIDEARGRNRR
jgi:hypothetical protein